jgi:hypothetical protein
LLADVLVLQSLAKCDLALLTGERIFVSTGHWGVGWGFIECWFVPHATILLADLLVWQTSAESNLLSVLLISGKVSTGVLNS